MEKAASPSGSPRPVSALTTPERGPSAALITRAASSPLSPEDWPRASAASSPSGRNTAKLPLLAGKLGKRLRESVALAIVETVRHPQHAVVRLAAELLFKRGRERRAVGRVRLRHHPANALARLLGAHGIADRLAGRGESEQHGAAVAAGALDRSLDRLAPLGPMRGRRPAIVDDEEEGTFAGETLLVGVQHGPRQSENQQGREQHAQGGQPPWAVRRRLLGGLEILQQPRRREHHDLRAWRRQPQQPPDGGKRGECREHPRLKEADCADGHHGCRPASVPLTGSGRGGR